MFNFDIEQKNVCQYQSQTQPAAKVMECIYSEPMTPVTENDLYDHLVDALSKAP